MVSQMMKVKLSKYERIAGLFVLTAMLGFVASLVGVAVKQGWFESRVEYVTQFQSGEGLHAGTTVQISGLNVGAVEDVELTADNQVKVKISVLKKFENKIRKDSVAQLVRPFLIGDRVLDISVGSAALPKLAANDQISSQESMDLMSLLSGKQTSQYLTTFSGMLDNLKVLAQAFIDKNRTQAFVDMFDRMDPLLKNLNTMSVEVIKLSKQATHDDQLKVVLGNLATTTTELNKMLPAMNEKSPELAEHMAKLVDNMAELSEQFKVVIPALAAVAPDLPHASKRAVEALDETVVLVKALQKSFFVRGNVEEVRAKEEKEALDAAKSSPSAPSPQQDQASPRAPASH
jgi:phospholipid/cholesterol/gamma-HCH transport system substrate-binding protein